MPKGSVLGVYSATGGAMPDYKAMSPGRWYKAGDVVTTELKTAWTNQAGNTMQIKGTIFKKPTLL